MTLPNFKKDWEKELNEGLDKYFKELGPDSYIGPVGTEGLYQIGKGCFTGKKGYEDFIKALNEELKKKSE